MVGTRSVGLVVVALVVVASAGCDPAVTDPAYWERAPAVSAGTGDASAGDGSAAAAGGAVAATSADGSTSTGAPLGDCASIALTTISYDGHYEPDNVGAIWITDASGAFVRTLERWGSRRLKNAVAWRASSGGNEVDAITGATKQSHVGHQVAWDCRDAAGAVRDAGVYQVHAEFTEEDSAENDPPGPHRVIAIDLAAAGPVVAADDAAYRDVQIVVRP